MSSLLRNRTGSERREGARVLIAEDDPNSRWVLCSLMRRLGYDCQTACDGVEALELAESFRPSLILMDLMMPRLDGLEATRRLKADARTREIPVVALTGNVTAASETAARGAGCDDFVPKPIVLSVLLDRLQPFLAT